MRPLSFLHEVWRHHRGRPNPPRLLTYPVTFRCNARCVMCDSWRKPSPDELTLPEIAAIFAQLPRLDGVRLSGGEPFLRPDFADIAGLALDQLRPRFLHVTTNGFLTGKVVAFCERRPRAGEVAWLVRSLLLGLNRRVRAWVHDLLGAGSPEDQAAMYGRIEPVLLGVLNRGILRHPLFLSMLGIHRAQLALIEREHAGGVPEHLVAKLRRVFTQTPMRENYFWRVHVRGSYTRECCPNYGSLHLAEVL